MEEVLRATMAGIIIAILKYVLILHGWTLWDLSLVSYSALIAGMFFIMAMTFQASLRDYKRAEETLGSARAKILALNDLNMVAKLNKQGGRHNAKKFTESLVSFTQTLKGYMHLHTKLPKLLSALDDLNVQCFGLHKHLTNQQVRVLLGQQCELREACSQIAFIKDLNFPSIGYIFLYGFGLILIGMQLFAHTEYLLLEIVFIFTLTLVLSFFADLIQDLDDCFGEKSQSYVADTQPLDNCIKALKASVK